MRQPCKGGLAITVTPVALHRTPTEVFTICFGEFLPFSFLRLNECFCVYPAHAHGQSECRTVSRL